MPNELPSLGADVVLEFQQSINNIKLFSEALDGLNSNFGSMERRIEGIRSSLSSLSSQVSRGSGRNLRAEIERELNDLILGNGIVVSKIGTVPLKIDAKTIRTVFDKVESEINLKLAEAYKNIVIQVDPSLQVGKIPISKDEFDEVNKAIARLVKVQLNNLVAAIKRHGEGLISAEDLAAVQLQIGRGTIQQIINKVKDHLNEILLNPSFNSEAKLEFTERDMKKIYSAVRSKVRESIENTVDEIRSEHETTKFVDNIQRLYNAVDESARDYIRNVTEGIQSISAISMTRPLDQLSNQLKRFMAKELGTDLDSFNKAFADHRFTNADIQSAELRRQFSRLENVLNRKIGGGLQNEVKEMIRQIESVQISYSPKLRYHIVQEINRINNQIVKKIREQLDIQFAHMRAEIDGVQVSPKEINRARKIREMGRPHYDETVETRNQKRGPVVLANDPYARRDEYFNRFGLEGAIINTFRHILAGSLVGTPIMLAYQALETFRTSQLEQLKMFSNLFAQNQANVEQRAAQGDTRPANQVAREIIKDLVPFIQNASQFYAIDYGKMSEVSSVGSRLLSTPDEIKLFTDIVGRIYSIDREGDPVESIAPGLEAFMGQFDLAVGELQEKVVNPIAVATNLTNATTEQIMDAISRSGSMFKEAGVSPEQAIAMIATEIRYTGLNGSNTGNFFKSILPRLQSDSSLRELSDLGIDVYDESSGVKRARSASDILSDISAKYDTLPDDVKRDLIMALFGTYQGSKGATLIDQFNTYQKTLEAIRGFNQENFNTLMANNLTAPIMQMQRAGTSVTLALTSVFEELSPDIVQVSQGLTTLAQAMRDHKDTLAELIRLLAGALVGFVAVYGFRKLTTAAGTSGSIKRIETLDQLLGYNSSMPYWQREGSLSKNLQGFNGINPAVIENSRRNRRFIYEALKDEKISPIIKELATMDEARAERLKSYVQDNHLIVKDMKDLLMVAEESRNYVPKRVLTEEERYANSFYNSGKLSKKEVNGLDKQFIENLTLDLMDKERFNKLSETPNGSKVIDFLSGLNDNELQNFQRHLEQLHRESGKLVDDIDKLAEAVDTYSASQLKSIEETRKSSPQMLLLSQSVDKVNSSLDNTNKKGEGILEFLGGISQKARGASLSIAGLASTFIRFSGQLAGFVLLGEAISDIMYQFTTPTDVKQLNRLQQDLKDFDAMKEYWQQFNPENYNPIKAAENSMKLTLAGVLDLIDRPFTDNITDITDIAEMRKELMDYAREKYGIKASGGLFGIGDESFVKQLADKGLTPEQLIDEMMSDQGNNSLQERYKKLQEQVMEKQYEESINQSIEMNKIQEAVRKKVNERMLKEFSEGQYQNYDLSTREDYIREQVDALNQKSVLEQLKAINEGYATDSEQYIKIRRDTTDKIISLYQDEINMVNKLVTDLENKIADMKKNGAPKEDINKAENDLAFLKETRDKAVTEFEAKRLQAMQEQAQLEFDSALSRINRAAQIAESNRTLQEAVNQLTMDRNSKEYIDANINLSRSRINDLQTQIEELKSTPTVNEDGSVNADQKNQIDEQIAQLQAAIAQERVKIKDLQLSSIGLYREDLQDKLAQMSNDYLQAKVDSGITDDNSPYLRNLRINQYNEQVSMFQSIISDLKERLGNTTDAEEQKSIQREIRDLQRQSLQAQLGILEEMKNTGGTFNLPDNVRAMSYYEYITRNNTHSTYTVQEGDTHITITLPNITDSTPLDRVRQIGKALGEGVNQGKKLRLQKQANPFGYRVG